MALGIPQSSFYTGDNREKDMNQTIPLVDLLMDCEAAVAQVSRQLIDYGLQVMRSFDLQTARSAHTHCTCPHHGTDLCDCQLVVLLVYGHPSGPGTLVAHGRGCQTQVALVHSPQQSLDADLENSIRRALSFSESSQLKNWVYPTTGS
ncbi:MAG: hypothetical protein A2Z45_09805 [Chloroflexi bacterium RBG_19FT_COMBO_55_16]|nr:MAG: hypothetical protein A2Z45_09805 [Chloroflexi bacterium RBG_19FT_COMBO_55_16]